MSDEAKTTNPKPATATPVRKKWEPAAHVPGSSRRMAWIMVGVATVLAILMAIAMFSVFGPKTYTGPTKLSKEFIDYKNDMAISPPQGWIIDDRRSPHTVFIKGPPEPGFPPLLILCWEPAPGRLETYVKEHKARVEYSDKTIVWKLDEQDAGIDGCRTERLEYDCNWQEDEKSPIVKVHALQFLLEDRPRFYRITGFVTAELYDKYKDVFEASARSFRRVPSPTPPPKILR